MKRLLPLMMAAAILVATLTGCGSPTDSFENQVKKGNYSQAIELYNEKIVGNAGDETAAANFLQSYLEESISGYTDGSLSDEDFSTRYATIEKVNGALWVLNNLEETYQQYLSLRDSKESYRVAMEHAENGDLPAAISALYFVVPEDTANYDAAQTKLAESIDAYQEQIITRARELAQAGNYDEAVFCVEEAAVIVGYTPDLDSCLVDLYTEKYVGLMEDAYASDDLVAVICAYCEATGNPYVVISADMTSKYSTCATKYFNAAAADAEEAFGTDKDYTSAIGILQAAIPPVEVDPTLVDQLTVSIQHYQSYIPVAITALTPTQKAEYIAVGDASGDDAKDVSGNLYDPSNIIHPTGGSLLSETASSEEESCVVYNLNFEYSTFTGTVYRPYRTLSFDQEWSKIATVKIYGDDVLLYESPAITGDTYDTFDFALDVSGVRNLKIVMTGVWSEPSGWIGIYSRHPKVCLAEGTLQK